MNKYNDPVEVIFAEEYKSLTIFELSNFLYHFKILYSLLAVSEEFQRYGEEKEPEKIKYAAKSIAKIISQSRLYPPYPNRYNLFRKDLKERDVFIAKIYKESPLTIWFIGISTLLVTSLIISGGEIEITIVPPQIKVKMPPIGEGIKRLKEAMKQ